LEAKTFVFNNGHGGGGGRNGLQEFLQAIALVTADVRFIIHSQVPITCNDRRVEVRYGNYQDYWDLFHEGDIFVFPHKFNGLSLPVQEAIGAGMPVLLPEFYPFTEWLPRKWMWDCKEVVRREAFKGVGVRIPFYESDPQTIATKIDIWANKDIERHSQRAREIAFQRSWHVLKNEYLNVLAHLCNIS
jgi:glycosyltransferase involved in cell wall biosynthesis